MIEDAKKCRNRVIKPYNFIESVWWGIKHIIVNIYIPIAFILLLLVITGLIQMNPILIALKPFILVFLIINLILIIIYLLSWAFRKMYFMPLPERSDKLNKTIEVDDTLTLGFVGDIMPMEKYEIEFDPSVINFFRGVDLMIGNLEGVLVRNSGIGANELLKNGRDTGLASKVHSEEILDKLKTIAGPNTPWLLCVSNNHSGDLGLIGFKKMLFIGRKGIFNTFGEEDYPSKGYPTNYRNNPILLNIVAGTMWSNYNKCRFVTRFECAHNFYDDNAFNILFPHWHYENEEYIRPSIKVKSLNFLCFGKYKTNYEIGKFYGISKDVLKELHSENKNLTYTKFPRQAIENIPGLKSWGLIFGHHSHVPQPIKIVKYNGIERLIFFSGGNFTSGEKRDKHRHGIIARCKIGRTTKSNEKYVLKNYHWEFVYNKDKNDEHKRSVSIKNYHPK